MRQPNAAGYTVGLSPLTILGIVFIVLKLIGEIGWSWWWVLAPFWIPWALVFVIFLIGAGIVALVDYNKRKRKKEARRRQQQRRY